MYRDSEAQKLYRREAFIEALLRRPLEAQILAPKSVCSRFMFDRLGQISRGSASRRSILIREKHRALKIGQGRSWAQQLGLRLQKLASFFESL